MQINYRFVAKSALLALMFFLFLNTFPIGGMSKSCANTTIVIEDCDTGVENQELSAGITMSDMITLCSRDIDNHGDFLKCVANVTNDWMKESLISGKEKGVIQSCAAKSDIGKRKGVPPVDISGTWLLYNTPQGDNKKGADCFYIHQEDGSDYAYFNIQESQITSEEFLWVSVIITDRNNLELIGSGYDHGTFSSFSGSATTHGNNIIGTYTHSDDLMTEFGTFRAIRSDCKRIIATVRNSKNQDDFYNLEFYVWDLIPEEIKIISGTVTGPRIGSINLYSDNSSSEYYPWYAVSSFGNTKPTAGDVYTFNVQYSDGTLGTVEATVRDILVDFPTPISPADGEVVDTLTPIFSWEPPQCACQGYYRIIVFSDWNDIWNSLVWSFYPSADTTSITYNFDGLGLPLSSGDTYGWALITFDDPPPGPDNFVHVWGGNFSIQ